MSNKMQVTWIGGEGYFMSRKAVNYIKACCKVAYPTNKNAWKSQAGQPGQAFTIHMRECCENGIAVKDCLAQWLEIMKRKAVA